MIITYICIFLIGASFASFINATLYRLDKGYKYPKIVYDRSHCEYCKKELSWIELIPVFGYILIKGKCSKCNKKINVYYPLSELYLGISFLLFYTFNIPFHLWPILIFLFILSYHDNIYRAVPKNIVHIFLVYSVFIFFIFNANIISLIATSVIATFLFILTAIMKKSFGMGDILVLISFGIVTDYKSYLIIFWLGVIIALLYSILVIIVKKRNMKKVKIPMIPFFAISFVIGTIYGGPIFDYLFNILLI